MFQTSLGDPLIARYCLAMSATSHSRFAILLDGALTPTDRLRAQLDGCRVLAADGGIRHAETLGLEPELWLGDFDSAGEELEQRFGSIRRQSYPSEKAVSDGEIAIRHALDQGAKHLVLVGALGGERSDHAFFNLAAAASLAIERTELRITLTSGLEEALPLLPGRVLRPDWPAGTLFSIPGFTAMSGLSVRNAKWPLDNVEVPFGSTLTLSNIAGNGLEIILRNGTTVAICQFDNMAGPV